MYNFYSSNILYIMFISCEYARRYTTHWTESEILLPWIRAWCMLDCVDLKMVNSKDKGENKDKAHHKSAVKFFRGSSDPSYLLDNQGTVIMF